MFSAPDKLASELAPKYASPHSIAVRLGFNVYELVDESNNDEDQVHIVDIEVYHGGREHDPDESIDEAPTDVGEVLEGIIASSPAGEKLNTAAVAAK